MDSASNSVCNSEPVDHDSLGESEPADWLSANLAKKLDATVVITSRSPIIVGSRSATFLSAFAFTANGFFQS